MQPIRNAMGKWRRTPDGKLRLGCCCEPGCLCSDCWTGVGGTHTDSPKYFMLEFSGISLASCVNGAGPPAENCYCPFAFSGVLNPTIIVEQTHPGTICCCWMADTGSQLRYRCGFFDPCTDAIAPTLPVYAILRKIPPRLFGPPIRFAVMLGRNVFGTFTCDAASVTWSERPAWELFVGYIEITSSDNAFCDHPVTVNNYNVTPTACRATPPGGDPIANAGYGGSCVVTPL